MANVDALRFTKTHEWIALRDSQGVVGVTQYAQEEISDVVFVELPKIGAVLQAGQETAVVESVKAAFSIYAPVSGVVAAVNDRLVKEPGLINTSPYEDGWIFTMTIQSPAELKSLMTHDDYHQWITQEKGGDGVHA